jgi:hypothetical protein
MNKSWNSRLIYIFIRRWYPKKYKKRGKNSGLNESRFKFLCTDKKRNVDDLRAASIWDVPNSPWPLALRSGWARVFDYFGLRAHKISTWGWPIVMNTIDLSWSRATHDWPKVIVFKIFQPRVVELSQIWEHCEALNYDEGVPGRQMNNNPSLSSAIYLLRLKSLYLVVKPVPPCNAARFLKVHIPMSSNSPARSLQTHYG